MATPKDVASWMAKKIDQEGTVHHSTMVDDIDNQFGKGFCYTNDYGGESISRAVLDEFRKLPQKKVKWSPGEKMWHKL